MYMYMYTHMYIDELPILEKRFRQPRAWPEPVEDPRTRNTTTTTTTTTNDNNNNNTNNKCFVSFFVSLHLRTVALRLPRQPLYFYIFIIY